MSDAQNEAQLEALEKKTDRELLIQLYGHSDPTSKSWRIHELVLALRDREASQRLSTKLFWFTVVLVALTVLLVVLTGLLVYLAVVHK